MTPAAKRRFRVGNPLAMEKDDPSFDTETEAIRIARLRHRDSKGIEPVAIWEDGDISWMWFQGQVLRSVT